MRPLTIELSEALVGGRIDKITQQNKTSILFAVRQPGKNYLLQILLNSQNPSAYLVQKPLENLPEPPTFCMVLRKKLESGRIAAIHQYESDRIIFIDVDTIGSSGMIETLTLVIELIGKYSNIILISDDIIVDSLKKIGSNNSRVRTVLPNQNYQLPPSQDKLNIFNVSGDEIMDKIKSDPAQRLSKSIMNTCQGFSPLTANEIIFRAGLSSDVIVNDLSNSDCKSLSKSLSDIRDNCLKPNPCLIVDSNNKVAAISPFELRQSFDNGKYNAPLRILKFESLSSMLEEANNLIGSYVPPDKERFTKLVHNELKRATNKIAVLEKELSEAENADEWRIRADNLLTYQYNLKDHADDEVTVADIYSETGNSIKIPIDKRITIAANVQNFYKKYDKLKRSTQHINEQIKLCHDEISYLETVEHSLTASTTLAEIDEIRSELIAGRYLKEGHKKTALSKKAQPFVFKAADGSEIFVGKNNYQNDRLRQSAQPDDMWFHTKDIPGSHVILKTNGLEPNEDTILTAAKIAAHFSKSRGSSKVPVDYTKCRFVKKPSGSKPGFVIFTNQHTVYVSEDFKFLLEEVDDQ